MTYNNNIPVANQTLGNSRPIINNDFKVIDNVFSKDHVEFNDENGIGPGKHTALHFPFQEIPTTNAGEIALYMKLVSLIPRLFMREPANGTEQQISGIVLKGQGAGKVGGFLPFFGGFSIGWGYVTVVAGTPLPITFAAECGSAFPTKCFVVLPVAANNVKGGSPIVTVSAVTPTGCTLGSVAAPQIYFIAIGN